MNPRPGSHIFIGMIRLTDLLREVRLSSIAKIEPYNDPQDEYAQDLDAYLQSDGVDWREESRVDLINPFSVEPSEWNRLSDDPNNEDSRKKFKDLQRGKTFAPILAVETSPGRYEAIDGIHRTYAFRMYKHNIPAIVITPRLENALSTTDTQMVNFMFNKYKDEEIPAPTPIGNKVMG